MTSENNSENVNRRPPLLLPLLVFLFVLYNNVSSTTFPSAAPRGNIEILGKQNELFPSGPVIKCLVLLDFCNAAGIIGLVKSGIFAVTFTGKFQYHNCLLSRFFEMMFTFARQVVFIFMA